VIPATGLGKPTLTKDDVVGLIKAIGLRPAERDNWYRVVKIYG